MAIPGTVYKDLEAGEIRLLKLSPAKSTSELLSSQEPLEGQLVHVRLNNSPEYTALSYFWGTVQERASTDCIQIRKSVIDITRNLGDALRTMRFHDKQHIWVDQICLRQGTSEMGAQVLKMFQIYQKAKEVAIWLGTGNRRSFQVMKYLREARSWLILPPAIPDGYILDNGYWKR